MAPLRFLILTLVLLLTATNNLCSQKTQNGFACPKVIAGIVECIGRRSLYVLGMGTGWINHCPGNISFHLLSMG